jgi:hypothetical protein
MLARGLASSGVLLAGQTGGYHPKEETLPAPVAPQPVAFSHRLHAGEAELPCLLCHAGARDEDFATLPSATACMTCHVAVTPDSPEVAKVRAAAESGAAIPWVRIYQVPDFVFFSHREHVGAGEACATCHGDVATRDVLEKEVSTGMVACLECHRARGAPVHCAACHVLGH